MPRPLLAAIAAMLVLAAGAAPAFARYGAFAYDIGAGKYGDSHGEETQRAADAAALKGCASPGCKIVFRTGPHQCGALATTKNGKIWGGAHRGERAAAELAALQDCQKRGSAQCKVQASECSR